MQTAPCYLDAFHSKVPEILCSEKLGLISCPNPLLPCFYLLDAIAENVYDVYASVFSRIVVPLFMDTYFQIDPNTGVKMEEMLLTWRTPGPDYIPNFWVR